MFSFRGSVDLCPRRWRMLPWNGFDFAELSIGGLCEVDEVRVDHRRWRHCRIGGRLLERLWRRQEPDDGGGFPDGS